MIPYTLHDKTDILMLANESSFLQGRECSLVMLLSLLELKGSSVFQLMDAQKSQQSFTQEP